MKPVQSLPEFSTERYLDHIDEGISAFAEIVAMLQEHKAKMSQASNKEMEFLVILILERIAGFGPRKFARITKFYEKMQIMDETIHDHIKKLADQVNPPRIQ